MKVKDWADHGWNEFAAETLGDDVADEVLSLLKEAWLSGARCALAKAQREISEHRFSIETSEDSVR